MRFHRFDFRHIAGKTRFWMIVRFCQKRRAFGCMHWPARLPNRSWQ
jgi:hypothetical protein